ncbi:MAG: KilA-N domain-containing protein [Methylovulum sp.]|nr:KilA-N domain-containing protein [Methylovulum sp.]
MNKTTKSKYEIVAVDNIDVMVDVSLLAKNDALYFNATEVAKQFGKKPIEWIDSKQAQEYIAVILKVENFHFENLIRTTAGGKYKGTWLHKKTVTPVITAQVCLLIANQVLPYRLAVATHVQKRVAEDLTPPADWRRDSQLKCNCKDCTELRLFLDDPHQDSWRFKAAENRREHVTQTISKHLCDVDQKTEKLSRPYSLICTKNQASYQRRVAQRQKDLDTLDRLSVEGVVNER